MEGAQSNQKLPSASGGRCRRICKRADTKDCRHDGSPHINQEQNSYAGVTNKLLAQKARKICVAYEGMEKFFPALTRLS